MRKDRETAENLRKEGLSYKQISERLKIPKSTLSEWFSGKDWSLEIRKKLTEAAQVEHTARIVELDRVRGVHLSRLYKEAEEEARDEFETLKYNPLFIAGVMLYWGEGDRKNKAITRLSNSDPELIRLFVQFLIQACRIPITKIKASILVYTDMDEPSSRRFWSFASGLPTSQFTKSIPITGRHKTNRLANGVCMVNVSNSYFKRKMNIWLKEMPNQLMKREYYEIIPQ